MPAAKFCRESPQCRAPRMASFPLPAIRNPDIQSARNGGEKRVAASNKTVERERRKSMSGQLESLHSLLPYPIPKTDKMSILAEAINYIPFLRSKLEDLKIAKAQLVRCKMDENGCMVNVDIHVEEKRVDITVWRLNQWPPLAEILKEVERQGLELISCCSFLSDAKYFHHFNTKCCDASVLPSAESLQNALQNLDPTPLPNV